jgi:hypothetical protein
MPLDLETAAVIAILAELQRALAVAMAVVDEQDDTLFCSVPTPLYFFYSNQQRNKHQRETLTYRPLKKMHWTHKPLKSLAGHPSHLSKFF